MNFDLAKFILFILDAIAEITFEARDRKLVESKIMRYTSNALTRSGKVRWIGAGGHNNESIKTMVSDSLECVGGWGRSFR
ncbi:hypothetical protein IQ249_08250 [Lusitaniella coriacea LEGE 07157]|uniref:Uncharacterized protein n=1 Tax=Lusitaniella coriacea LEGE 07157 TaxID=945747 RepID=A0A8J7DVL3_9CYAN|nr:hypothetical protein [Lusitaniella coriacea]MBE9115881.1 hypothetical protein [Lusitaniella coriacea LEGE 07157]